MTIENYINQMYIENKNLKISEKYVGKRILVSIHQTKWRSIKEIAKLAECSIKSVRRHTDKFIINKVIISKRAHDGNLILLYKINTGE